MPPKIRELIAELERNGFVNRGGKASHRNYEHRSGLRVTISGKLLEDAQRYQIKLVRDNVRKLDRK